MGDVPMTENLQKTPGSVATVSLVGDLASLLQPQNSTLLEGNFDWSHLSVDWCFSSGG